MLLTAKIILSVAGLYGLVLAGVTFFRHVPGQSRFEARRWRRTFFGFLLFVGAGTDLFLIFAGYADSFEALLGFVMYASIFYALSRVDLNDFFEQLGNIGNKSGR